MKRIIIKLEKTKQEAMIGLATFLKGIGFTDHSDDNPDYMLYDLRGTLSISVEMYKSRTKDVGTITLEMVKNDTRGIPT